MVHHLEWHLSFFDPPWTSDGKPYGPERYRDIVKERYIISKHTNTSYVDTANITPLERSYLIEFITEDLKTKRDIISNMGM